MTKITNLLFAASTLALSSCAIFNNPYKTVGDEGKTQVTETVQADNKIVEKANTDNTTAKTKPAKEVVSNIAGQLDGEWVIVKVGKNAIVKDENMPYVNFTESDGRFYASNGCNVLNGSFTLSGSSEITFDHVLSTLMACDDNQFESAINKVLCDGVKVKVELSKKGQESFLTLKSHSGNTLMVLRRHNMEVLNGQWQIKRIDQMDVDDPEVNIFLDIPELRVHGNTGCNYFNGSIMIDPEKESSISFSQMAVTMRLCHNSDIEIALLVALEQTSHYKLDHDTLYFLDNEGKTLVKLQR